MSISNCDAAEIIGRLEKLAYQSDSNSDILDLDEAIKAVEEQTEDGCPRSLKQS